MTHQYSQDLNAFDTENPEFKKTVGVEFKILPSAVKTNLIAQWVLSKDQEKLKTALIHVNPETMLEKFEKKIDIRGLLLIQPIQANQGSFDPFEAFEFLNKNHGVYEKAAAYAAYAGHFEYLKKLPKEDYWRESINPEALFKAGISFLPKRIQSETEGLDWQRVFLKINLPEESNSYNGYGSENYKTVWEMIAYHQNEDAIQMTQMMIDKHLTVNTPTENLFNGLRWWLKNKTPGVQEQAVEWIKKLSAWSELGRSSTQRTARYGYDQQRQRTESLLVAAAIHLTDPMFKNFCDQIPQKQLEQIAESDYQKTFKLLIFRAMNQKIEILDNTLKKANLNGLKDQPPPVHLSDLWKSIQYGDLPKTKNILGMFPEWKECTDWVYENRNAYGSKSNQKGSKKGNCLALAVRFGQNEIAQWLFEENVNEKPAKELLNYQPFKNYSDYAQARSLLDNLLLKKNIKKMAIESQAPSKPRVKML